MIPFTSATPQASRGSSPGNALLHVLPLLPPLFLALFLALVLGACNSGSDDDNQNNDEAFVLQPTNHAVAANTTIVGDGRWLVYLASEATTGAGGTDMNLDLDVLDSIAVRVDTDSHSTTNLRVATRKIFSVRKTVFLEVSEAADGADWNGDMDTADRVLLYHRPGAQNVNYLAEVSSSVANPVIKAAGRIYFVGAAAPAAQFDTDLFVTRVNADGATPTAPTMVTTTAMDPNMDGLQVAPVEVHADVLFLRVNEVVDGELNGDGDATDTSILALLDAGDPAGEVLLTGLATPPGGGLQARGLGGDWLVGFLVDEAAQGANLNLAALFAPNWQPLSCSGREDTDMSDFVLHWLLVNDLTTGGSPVNTGLVASATGKVHIHPAGYTGVVCPEADEGIMGGCDLNGDGDMSDGVFRWVQSTNPSAAVLPVANPTRMLALSTSVAGGTGGVVRVGSAWVVLVDEAADGRDHDGDAGTDRLVVGARVPGGGQNWNFLHGSSNPNAVTVTWMQRDRENGSRFLAAFSEATLGADLNGDGDMTDAVPTFPTQINGGVLTFPGLSVATDPTDAGIVTEQNVGYFRASEADHDQDLNGDGDRTDMVLMRLNLTGAPNPFRMGSLNEESLPSVVFGPGSASFGAFLYQENLFGPGGQDLNGDGDAGDLVIRYFQLP